MPKKFLGQFFLLSAILLFSCENNDNCIDADDYGNVEKEIINISASLSSKCLNIIKPESNKDDYENIDKEATDLIECLTKTNHKLNTDPDIKLIIDSLGKDITEFGCLKIKLYENRKACETICESICIKKQETEPSKGTNYMIWKPNTPRSKDSDGIDITPDSNIFVSAEGEIILNKQKDPPRRIDDLSTFKGNKVVKLEFNAEYDNFSTRYYHQLQTKSVQDIEKMQGLARRSMFFFTPETENNDPIKLEKKIDKVEQTLSQPIGGIISHNSSTDSLVNFRMDKNNVNCNDATIKVIVSIKKNDGSNIDIYEVTNLKLSEEYTTKNIPTYSGSTIKIYITNNTIPPQPPEACIIKMQTQKYLDVQIPYSGIAQFKNSAGSCKLYGRIINPRADIMTYKPPNPPLTEIIGIKNDADSDTAFILSKGKAFNNTGGAYKVKNVYIGLNAYASKYHKDLADSSCKKSLNLTNCAIESTSCSIGSSDSSSITPIGCGEDGSGKPGLIETDKAGNGGGGGGNVGGEQGKYTNPYKTGGGGKGGQSYINPEFQLDKPAPDYPNLGKGKGAPNNDVSYRNGYVDLWWEGSSATAPNLITFSNQINKKIFTIPAIDKKLHYRIYGGGGGAGGNCAGKSGGKGGDGDFFSGTLDFSNFSSGSDITLKIKVGSGGNSGKDCGLTFPENASQNPDKTEATTVIETNKKLKGGNGGIVVDITVGSAVINEASGGAGGSASYISLERSDEVDDTDREDFLVIAGGGGGGGGAKEINGYDANSAESYTNKLQSNVNGLRLAVALEATPIMSDGFSSDFYEYDDFFTKTVLSSVDPLKNIDVTTSHGEGFFVRQGQILRILPKSFDDSGCNNEILMKITRRPAVLCLNKIKESIKNPVCIQNIVTSLGQTTYEGCLSTSTCVICNNLNTADPCPTAIQAVEYCLNLEKCTKITCSTAGTDTTPNAGCRIAPIPTDCLSGCSGCASKRKNEMEQSPIIDVNASICYNFENRPDISVYNFLNEYNSIPSASQDTLKDLVADDKKIQKIENYNPLYKFGNFNDYKQSPTYGYFETKDPVSFNSGGNLQKFFIKNDDFKSINKIALRDSSGNYPIDNYEKLYIFIVSTPIQQKGRGLQVALCKEHDENSNFCSSANPDISGKKILTYFINDPESADNAFKFNSFGVLERVKALKSESETGITIADCSGWSPRDNFLCYKTSDKDKIELKKYRLIFKVKDGDDNYANNSGEYNIKVEKKMASKLSSGGVIDGILEPIIKNLDGEKDILTTPENENELKPGIVRNFYRQLTKSPLYRSVLTLTIVLALSFYGMGYLIGVNELKHSEVVKILLKIGFIYLFTSTEMGWSWFNKFFVGFFRDATDYITFSVAETFDYENSEELRVRIKDSNFYDRGILFKSVDGVIDLILAGAVQKKIMALLFSSIFGWLYFLILYYSLLTYVYAVANSMLLYITCQIIVSILFVLGPIFFIFLMFKVTKDMFDNWLKALIGFSLQQIFLVMTLALFNSFVSGFLKLALGYRVCWTDILSLNLYVSKLTLLNFWTVAGTNSPNLIEEDSPDESFGNDQNMPSIYLFLYLMLIVSLMKKFIELFTNLAVTISGGLKASTIAGDSATIGKSIFKAASAVAGKLYENTAGRVVSNIDNTLFDSGKIASERRKTERQQFTNDMKTRVTLNKEGNKAVSEYKKDNALSLSGMSVDKQKETLRGVRQDAIKNYADSNGISSKEIDRITNDRGLKNSGSNLFGMAIQAGRQAVFSGGSLRNSMNDKNIDIDASFSKSEANSALKRMKPDDKKINSDDKKINSDGKKMSANDNRDKFIEAVKNGNIHVNKGSIENARKMAITAVKAPVKAIFNPKATVFSASKAAWSAAKKPLSTIVKKPLRITGLVELSKKDKLKKEVIKNLEDTGKITKQYGDFTRTKEEKLIIAKAFREKSVQEKVSLPKVTSKSVVKNLEAEKKFINRVEKNNGALKYNEKDISYKASFERVGDRMFNLIKTEDMLKKSNRAEKIHEENFKNLEKERLEKEQDPHNENSIKNLKDKINPLRNLDEAMQNKGGLNLDSFKRDDKYDFKKMIPFYDDGTRRGGLDIKGLREEASKNPELVKVIKENRYNINEISSKLKDAEKKTGKINEFNEDFKNAQKIVKEKIDCIKKYEGIKEGGEKRTYTERAKRAGKFAFSKAISPGRFLFRGANYLSSKAQNLYNSARGKEEKNTKVSNNLMPTFYQDREKYKKAVKAVKEFNKIKDPKEFKKFVEKHKKTLKDVELKESLGQNSSANLSTQTMLTATATATLGRTQPSPPPSPTSTPVRDV